MRPEIPLRLARKMSANILPQRVVPIVFGAVAVLHQADVVREFVPRCVDDLVCGVLRDLIKIEVEAGGHIDPAAPLGHEFRDGFSAVRFLAGQKTNRQLIAGIAGRVGQAFDLVENILHFNGACEPVVEFELLDSLATRGALNDDSDELDIKKSYGCTNTGRAIMTALQAVDEQKTEWRKNRAENVFQPLMFLLTDGYPDAGLGASEEEKAAVERAYRNAAEEIQRREKEDGNGRAKITFAAAGVQRRNGCSANIPRLKELTSYADHVVAVTDDADGSVDVAGLSQFFDVIYTATTTTVNGKTDTDDIISVSLSAAQPK